VRVSVYIICVEKKMLVDPFIDSTGQDSQEWLDKDEPVMDIINPEWKAYEQYCVGAYIIGHFNAELMIGDEWEAYWHENEVRLIYGRASSLRAALDRKTYSFNEYGVCDSPEQFLEKFGNELKESQDQFCVFFTKIEKSNQPDDGGWRWHKWGEYVGDGEITTEYLYDEPNFEFVYCFHIYKKK